MFVSESYFFTASASVWLILPMGLEAFSLSEPQDSEIPTSSIRYIVEDKDDLVTILLQVAVSILNYGYEIRRFRNFINCFKK